MKKKKKKRTNFQTEISRQVENEVVNTTKHPGFIAHFFKIDLLYYVAAFPGLSYYCTWRLHCQAFFMAVQKCGIPENYK